MCKLRVAVSASLDEIKDLKTKLAAAQQAVDSLNIAVDAAKKAIDANTEERASHERTLAIAERAIKEQQDLIGMYTDAIKTLTTLADMAIKRAEKLENERDRANKRTAILGVILTVIGVAVSLKK